MNVCVIFGGESVEHDVSILTGLHAAKHLPRSFNSRLVYITRDGKMLCGKALSKVDFYSDSLCRFAKRAWFHDGSLCTRFKKFKVDAVINCCHGGVGEDGRLASYFDVLGIPVTSCKSRAGYEMQSKSRTREVLVANGFVQPTYKVLKRADGAEFVGSPLVVKPDSLGSSIGISVAHNQKELDDAIELAFKMDDTVIVEEFINDAIEVNCAAFNFGGRVITSACEVIKKKGAMFDFDTKYLDTASGFIKKSELNPDGGLAREITDEIKNLAAKAYEIFGARGVIRADFLMSGGKIYLNEINTVPGFLAYHLWQRVGLSYTTLLQMLAEEAIKSTKKDLETAFQSDILQKNRVLVE
jgi:D-alanine-D-alanine ligase